MLTFKQYITELSVGHRVFTKRDAKMPKTGKNVPLAKVNMKVKKFSDLFDQREKLQGQINKLHPMRNEARRYGTGMNKSGQFILCKICRRKVDREAMPRHLKSHEEEKPKEKVNESRLRVAIKDGDKVHISPGGKIHADLHAEVGHHNSIDGFVTHDGKFLDRKQAMDHVRKHEPEAARHIAKQPRMKWHKDDLEKNSYMQARYDAAKTILRKEKRKGK